MIQVATIIVTFNRKELLIQCIEAIYSQKFRPTIIYIIDNQSTDGTYEFLKEKGILTDEQIYNDISLKYIQLPVNGGGSMGFYKGLKQAYQDGPYDYYWVMDDDVLPEVNCLEILLEGMDENHKVCIPNRTCENFKDNAVIKMNFDNFFKRVEDKQVISDFTGKEKIEVVDFAFEGPLFNSEILSEIGLPDDKYFLLFDDSDYAYRCTKITKIYFMVNAKLNRQLPLPNISEPIYWKQYYMLRNSFVFDMKYGKNFIFKRLRPMYFCLFSYLRAISKWSLPRIRYTKKAYHDARHNLLGKQVKPGEKFDGK